MRSSEQPQTKTESRGAKVARRKPFRFQLGIGLLVLYPVMYLVAAVVAFLPLEAGLKPGVIVGGLAAAEVILLLGIACVGKEAYQAIKTKLRRKMGRAVEPDEQ